MLNSFLIVLSFISIFPVYKIFSFSLEWNNSNLKYFCVCLPLVGIIFGFSWSVIFLLLSEITKISALFRGFIFEFLTLTLTGGLHMDGLMDTSDAIFSHKDRESKLKILSDTHSGAFAVISCVLAIMSKTFLISELFPSCSAVIFIPIFSRLGMAILLNNLQFAKSTGLAVILGSSRNLKNNYIFTIMFVVLSLLNLSLLPIFFVIILIFWRNFCIKIFGGITGDLLGAFVEISEIFMLTGTVIENCI